jgi:glycerophosphoryl diester phosphodiesterase
VNVEIKSFPANPPGLVEAVLDAIEQTGTAARVLLSCFDHRDLVRVPALIDQQRRDLRIIPRGALVSTPLLQPGAYLTGLVGAHTFHVSAQCLGADSNAYRRQRSAAALRGGDVAELKSHGIPILVYTVNDHSPGGLADHLAELGVDGLFTDDPAGMRDHFGRGGEGRERARA